MLPDRLGNGWIGLNVNSITKYQRCVYIYGSQKKWQVNREKRETETFILWEWGGDGESYSGCNADWNLLVMEKGRNYLWIFTAFVIDLFWLVIGATEKVLSHSPRSLWNSQLLDCYSTAGDGNKRADITQLVKSCLNGRKITEFTEFKHCLSELLT